MSRFAGSCENYKILQNWKNRRVDVNLSKRAPTRSAISAKTVRVAIIVKSAKKLEKSSSRCKPVKEGPDKVCDFCENFDYCKICEKLEKSSSRCKPVKEVPDKVCDFCENCESELRLL